MFDLDWFPKWNRENPKDVYGPAIVIGAVGGAVLVAAFIVAWGNPAQTSTTQTGPRGAGMGVVEFVANRDAVDPTIAAYTSSKPIIPGDGAALAKDAIGGADPALGDLTVENYERTVAAMREWTGIPTLFNGEDTYQTRVARRMIEMTRFINEEYDGHVAPSGVNCYTCHRGESVPSDIWFKRSPVLKNVSGWSANQNFATLQSSSTSLPTDALEQYLLGDEAIAVHDLAPRVENEGTASIQNAERTYSLMNYYANSLGVNCTFCHNTRAFYDGAQVTPQWAVANEARAMVQDLNNDYLVPLKDVYPANRLGPRHSDAPKAACKTCHKGVYKPLGGMEMTSDWPELVSTEAPVYE